MSTCSLHTDRVKTVLKWYEDKQDLQPLGIKVTGAYHHKPDPYKPSISKNLNGEVYAVDTERNELLISNNPFPALAQGIGKGEHIHFLKRPNAEQEQQYLWVRFSHIHGLELIQNVEA